MKQAFPSPDIIRNERVKLLYERMPGILVVNAVVSALLSLAIWLQTSNRYVIYWLVIFELFVAFRYLSHKFFIAPAKGKVITRGTEYHYALLAGISSLAWSSCLVVFNPKTLIEVLPIALTLMGMIGGSVAALSYVWLAYAAFIIPVSISLAITFFSFGDQVNIILSFMVIFYLFACLYFGIGFHRVLTETLILRHEKSDLLAGLEQQKNIAEQANVAKSKFLAAASHDLRQPLHALSLFIDVLKNSRSDSEREKLFPKIDLSLGALSNLFNALLDISKLDAGTVKPDRQHFYVSELLNDLSHEFDSELEKNNLFLKTRSCHQVIYSDRLLLERILRNLIGNAIRYTKTGGILVACRARKEHIILQVWDTGNGIPDDKRSEVFVEFQQLNNPHRDRNQGLGLGLAIVRRLCQLLGHNLELRSRLGKGSVFSVTLPRGNMAHSNQTQTQATKSSYAWDLNGQHIVVVDDEYHILDAMRTLLEKWGCEVITAESLTDAIAQLKSSQIIPSLILSDLRLRDGEIGTETIQALRDQFGSDIPGLIITGDTAPEEILIAKNSGFKLLHKPVKPAQLSTAIYQQIK